VQLRARYYNPVLGVFPSLDPLEGGMDVPMSLNRHMYVQGNVANAVDPSGMLAEGDLVTLAQLSGCAFGPVDCSQVCQGGYPKYPLRTLSLCGCPSHNANVLPEQIIKAASVVIVFGCYYGSIKGNCRPGSERLCPDDKGKLIPVSTQPDCTADSPFGCSRSNGYDLSMGVLTPSGILTHNHFLCNHEFTHENNLDFVRSFDWIEFRGMLSTVHVNTQDISMSDNNKGVIEIQLKNY
jgi:hypothetical protein